MNSRKSALVLAIAASLSAPPAPAWASSGPADSSVEKASVPCAPRLDLTAEEDSQILMFNARLSVLAKSYGQTRFESRLGAVVSAYWPETKAIQVSPTYFERARVLVERERLKNSIALTIGLTNPAWAPFEKHMHDILVRGGTGNDLLNPYEKSAVELLKEINRSTRKGLPASELASAEAIARVTNMYSTMSNWRAINREIIQEAAETSARTVAIVGVGMVGIGILYSTLVFSGPAIAIAGSTATNLASGSALAPLLVKMAEAAAGAGVGFVGAPAAQALVDSYEALTDAAKNSANDQTNYLCELTKRMNHWKSEAGEKTLSAALIGSGMGIAGGVMTFTSTGAKIVLWATGLGVGVAQLYEMGQLGSQTIEALARYKMAEEAQQAGDREKALRLLKEARDLAQSAGEHLLENVIIGLLSFHVANHFTEALHGGEKAIRALYAASADTLPSAGRAAMNMANSVLDKTKSGVSDEALTQLTKVKSLQLLSGSEGFAGSALSAEMKREQDTLTKILQDTGAKVQSQTLLKVHPSKIRSELLKRKI